MLNYLVEIRKRLIFIAIFFVVAFIVVFGFSDNVFAWLIHPLQKYLSSDSSLIITQITTPIYTPIMIAFDGAVILSIPFIIFQIWKFIYPALSTKEAFNLRLAISVSLSLFLVGVLFCYFVFLPYIFKFIISMVPNYLKLFPDLAYAIDFITRMLLVFGVCFQLPIIVVLLIKFNMIDLQSIRSIRPYFIVFAFIIGMFLTPPDVFSQVMLAIPLIILFEITIWVCCRFFKLDN
ncbi:MAG: twin arginine-targeting protein translocase TatC [Legionellales bacterium RIFCSPHIGHO2_12_FULL_35_11]|nr:MAG: twin arginine-targeting protein translocase TatC [Legionellales bacterium RIFCSPHIGHO2_12_FULL_35_11]